MVGKGVKRGAVALVPSASAFVSPAGNERTAMSVEREEGRKGGREEGRKGGREEERKRGREEREKERRGDYLKLAESLVRQQS
ncbi:hypothetical protein WN51_10335 [Melipona quadrifasciata]|uniref:Uncharacterized protein n=1 Tax=Melipona quadrifasciata TaxID=166423 RepID=A0A0M9A709_9HYME|nr:hypothetical protein WN51_10335 [Melipona quadrifasciata]